MSQLEGKRCLRCLWVQWREHFCVYTLLIVHVLIDIMITVCSLQNFPSNKAVFVCLCVVAI